MNDVPAPGTQAGIIPTGVVKTYCGGDEPDRPHAALAGGAEGLIVEVHPDPETALSDGHQSLDVEGFSTLVRDLRVFAEAAGRTV